MADLTVFNLLFALENQHDLTYLAKRLARGCVTPAEQVEVSRLFHDKPNTLRLAVQRLRGSPVEQPREDPMWDQLCRNGEPGLLVEKLQRGLLPPEEQPDIAALMEPSILEAIYGPDKNQRPRIKIALVKPRGRPRSAAALDSTVHIAEMADKLCEDGSRHVCKRLQRATGLGRTKIYESRKMMREYRAACKPAS